MRNGWTDILLEDILEPIYRIETVAPDTSYRLLGVRLEGRGAFHRETKLGSEISAKVLNQVRSGDLIYSRLYAWKGAFSMIGEQLDGCYVSNEFPLFRALPSSDVELWFLAYWLRLSNVWKEVEADCQGSTPTTRNRYNETYFLKLRVPFPPLAEQKRIVAHLDAIEAGLSRVQRLREEQKQHLLAALCSTFHKIEANADWIEMGEVAPLVRREVFVDTDGSYPELGIRSFGRGTFHKPDVLGMETTKRLFEIHAGDLVFNNVFAWEGAVAVATQADHGRVGSHRFITCVCDEERVDAEILQFYFLTAGGLEKLGQASPGGAGRNRTLGIGKLAKILVPVPPIESQREFKALLDLRVRIQREAQRSKERISALTPSLLDCVFNG